MFYQLGVRVPLTDTWLELTSYDRTRSEADSAMQMAHQGGDIVRDANKPSATLYAGGLDHLLDTPSPLDDLLQDDARDTGDQR